MNETCDTCSTCFYYRPDNDTVGHCRIHPPTLVMLSTEDDDDVEQPGVWPQVQAHDWCGEHAAPAGEPVQRSRQPLVVAVAAVAGVVGGRVVHRIHTGFMQDRA